MREYGPENVNFEHLDLALQGVVPSGREWRTKMHTDDSRANRLQLSNGYFCEVQVQQIKKEVDIILSIFVVDLHPHTAATSRS